MKNFTFSVFTVVILLSTNPVSAQESNSFIPGSSTNTIFRLHIVSLGIGLEQAVAPKVSVLLDLSYGSDYNSDRVGNEFQWLPYLSFEPRYYFNQQAREQKGKRIDYFSGQFITFQTRVGFPVGDESTWYSFAPMWGFQRTLGKKAYWSFQIGPGIQGSAEGVHSDFNGDFKLGFIL
jgi:hypothetical protein